MAVNMHTVFRMVKMILIIFLLLIIPGCANTGHGKYLGVGSRNGKYYCSMRILEKSDMKFFATYDTEEEAARACDVVTFYTNRASSHYNFPDSVTFIELTCKRRPQEYDELIIQDPVQYTRLIRSFMLSQAENLMRNLFPAKPANRRTRRLQHNDNCGVRRGIGISERICRDRPDHPHAESVQAPLSCYSLYCVSKKIASILQTLPSSNRLMWLNDVVTPFLQEKGGDSPQRMCIHEILEKIRASHPGDQRNHMGDENLGTARAGTSSNIVADSEGLLCDVLKLLSPIKLDPKVLMWLIVGQAFLFCAYIQLLDVVGISGIVTSQEKAALPTSPKKTICALEHFPVEDVLAGLQVCTNNSSGASTCEIYEQALPHIASNPSAGSLGPVIFYIDEGLLQWKCFDTTARRWRKMPPLSCLPAPDPRLWHAAVFVAGGGGLFCVNVGKPPGMEEIFVCNPFTQEIRKLPPLNYRRHPMLIHVLDDKTSNTYNIIAAGSRKRVCGTESLSLKTEVYDSRLETWVVAGDVPGPIFAIHNCQTGEYVRSKELLLCTGSSYEGREILAYDVRKGEWISTWSGLLPSYPDSKHQQGPYVIAQLMKFEDEVFLFTEQDSQDGEVIHCIHRLDILECADLNGIIDRSENWTRVMEQSKGIRSWHPEYLEYPEYPEYVCVPHGKDKFAIFNNIEHTGVVYNICLNSEQLLPSPTVMLGQCIYLTNPITSMLEPNCNILP